jgi:tetratricopeptide (TPR) repeat protein
VKINLHETQLHIDPLLKIVSGKRTFERGVIMLTIFTQTSCHLFKVLRFVTLLVALLLVASLAQAQSLVGAARVSEAPLTIPTYELGPPNPNPALLDWGRRKWRPVYPYPMLDALTNHKIDKSYKAVYLENEYLRVTVLPELGGHLYEIFDKTTNRDVLYTNHVVKYGMVAIRGAWVSGGIEWNFPDGHTLTTVSPIDYVTRMEEDGSATVTVGDTERVQGMQWAVVIRLRPGRRVVETEARLNNRRETPGRYWYWSTAAAPATDDLRFAYPMRETYPHTFWPVFSFPKEKGVDIGTYREVTNDLSLFARNSKRDFFGIYYEKSDHGVVHVADHREVPGKKTWTWGTDDAGKIWINKLTETDGQYVEFQAGRFETQMEHEFIAPHRVEHFREYWYPVEGLGGSFMEATPDAALRLTTEGHRAHVRANFTSRFDDAQLVVEAGPTIVHSERVNLSASAPFVADLNLPVKLGREPLTVTFKSRDGRELIRYRTDTPIDGNPDFQPAQRAAVDPTSPSSAEQSYLSGLAADKKSNEVAAREAYQEALRRDPGFAPAHIALGLSFYRSGEYEKAATHLEQALRRNKDAADAHYYLGLVRRAQGKPTEAAEQWQWLVRSGQREAIARYELGEMALEAGHLDEALEQLRESVRLNPGDLKGRTVLAMAERLSGNLQGAEQRIKEVLAEMPIDYLALSEQAEVYRAEGKEVEARRAANELWRLLNREPDAVLELVFDYGAAGQVKQAQRVLEEAIGQAREERIIRVGAGNASPVYEDYAMLHYTLGYFYELSGESGRARDQYAKGAKSSPSFVFPHRVEEIRVLRGALRMKSSDGRAAYYLGNVLASKGRGEEALSAWREAIRLDPSNGIAHRNLGLALWQVAGQKEQALAEYGQALRSAGQDYHLYVERDGLLSELGRTDERIRLLEAAPAEVRSRSAVVQALASAYVYAGRFADAVSLLEQTTFTSGEGEFAALGIYRQAHLGLARRYEQEGKHREAAAEYLKATEYPANLGVGRPALQSQAREYVAAARELEAAGQSGEAAKWWERAATEGLNSPTQPEEPWSEHYYWKAVALEHVGRKAEAEALYERLARLANEEEMRRAEPSVPEGAIRYVLAGVGLKALGKREEARAALEEALKMEPGNELARNQLNELQGERRTTSARP